MVGSQGKLKGTPNCWGPHRKDPPWCFRKSRRFGQVHACGWCCAQRNRPIREAANGHGGIASHGSGIAGISTSRRIRNWVAPRLLKLKAAVRCPVAKGPRVSTTLKKWVHDPTILGNDPLILGNDPIFQGSWRLQGDPLTYLTHRPRISHFATEQLSEAVRHSRRQGLGP